MSRRKLQVSDNATSQSSTSDVSPSILITVLILAIAVILFASLYLLLRFLRRNRHITTTTAAATTNAVTPPSLRQVSPVIDSLPVFTYDRLTAKDGGDCAVCLSRFEKNDVLRLLPVCCHAFHVECIDTWLHANMTCPLCRSSIYLPEKELLSKMTGERSFRVEIGNVSNRRNDVTNSGEIQRSYSISGAFDYVISAEETAIADVTSSSFRRTMSSEVNKEVDTLAAEVGTRGGSGGGGWLKDYLSSSFSCSSFRSSGRFFTGSSRRSTFELPRENELTELEEASRLGNEIGELFRWLSGV